MPSVDEQVVDFYYELFDQIFSSRFRPRIQERLKRDAVQRQVQEAAGATSQTLTRFFLSQQLSEEQVANVLGGLAALKDLIGPEDVANPNRTPEALAEELSNKLPCPSRVRSEKREAVYRIALYSIIQGLMQVGPVMAEWQRLSFSSTFEMLRRIVQQLNQITEGLEAFSRSGQSAADERYELAYRDQLLQRFYRVEAGTVRMATNLNYDLRQLFVMPRITVRPRRKLGEGGEEFDAEALMNLSAARAIFGERAVPVAGAGAEEDDKEKKERGVAAVEQVRRSPRNVVVGAPGGGKSTFLEWLQLAVANVDEEMAAGGGQAIPLLLRVRQLKPKELPRGAALVEKAAGRSMASLMPAGWVERQMKAGRVLFMLDGLDETEPALRDKYVLPWLAKLCKDYPDCLYLVSSRPVGYPAGTLRKLKFAECDLQDFGEPQVTEYAHHWCIARRLAQNEPEEEAREEGEKEGDQIVAGFKDHPYIRNLARNPLMLSAICLVNYFEGGQLPKDRALLYKLCVEGLLHHWDARRGIRSDFTLDEKLRVCREVAIQMQADDRAEYEAAKVLKIFAEVLGDKARAKKLLEHIRYRTGLLIERRPEVFAFAHLTFQEYLAARAVYEGNRRGVEAEQLAREHDDERWSEVIALYCGVASMKAARKMIERLAAQSHKRRLSKVLTEAFLSSVSDMPQDKKLRIKVLKRVAIAPFNDQLMRFPVSEVEPIANQYVGSVADSEAVSESFIWLLMNPRKIKFDRLMKRLQKWQEISPLQRYEIQGLIHQHGADRYLMKLSLDRAMYLSSGPTFPPDFVYNSQAELAITWLSDRQRSNEGEAGFGAGTWRALLQSLRVVSEQERWSYEFPMHIRTLFERTLASKYPEDTSMWQELVTLTRRLAGRFKKRLEDPKKSEEQRAFSSTQESAVDALGKWADKLESLMLGELRAEADSGGGIKSKRRTGRVPSAKRSVKKAGKGSKKR